MKQKLRVLGMFLENARYDFWNHVRYPCEQWEVAEACVWLEDLFAKYRPHRRGE